jgi:hypothetical protein
VRISITPIFALLLRPEPSALYLWPGNHGKPLAPEIQIRAAGGAALVFTRPRPPLLLPPIDNDVHSHTRGVRLPEFQFQIGPIARDHDEAAVHWDTIPHALPKTECSVPSAKEQTAPPTIRMVPKGSKASGEEAAMGTPSPRCNKLT